MKFFSKGANFFSGVKTEMQKVSWSSKDELIGSTWVVIVSTAIMAIVIGFVDIILSRIVSLLLRY